MTELITAAQVARVLGLPADATAEKVLSECGLLAALRAQVAHAIRAEVRSTDWAPAPDGDRWAGRVLLGDLDLSEIQRLGYSIGTEVRILVTTAAVQGADPASSKEATRG